MHYHFEDPEEMPSLEWEDLGKNGYKTEITKNGVPFVARLLKTESSWMLKLTNSMTGKYALELRFRNLHITDAMVKSEFYILENLQ